MTEAIIKNHLESRAMRRVMVGTDRSETADRAVHWAAGFADRYDAELFVVHVMVPQYPSATESGTAERTRAAAANNDLAHFARQGPACDRGGRTPHRCQPWPKAGGELPGHFTGGYGAAASVLASGITVMAAGVAEWVPITFGVVAALLTAGVMIDLLRGRRIQIVYDVVRSGDEDFLPSRLIERNTAFSIKYAITIIARPTSLRSTCRMKDLLGIGFVEALFIIRLSLIEGLLSAKSNLLRLMQLTLLCSGRNIHRRLYPS